MGMSPFFEASQRVAYIVYSFFSVEIHVIQLLVPRIFLMPAGLTLLFWSAP